MPESDTKDNKKLSPKAFLSSIKPVIKEITPRYLQTVFRHGYDKTGLTKSKIMFSNVFFHFQPVKGPPEDT